MNGKSAWMVFLGIAFVPSVSMMLYVNSAIATSETVDIFQNEKLEETKVTLDRQQNVLNTVDVMQVQLSHLSDSLSKTNDELEELSAEVQESRDDILDALTDIKNGN